MGLKEAVVHCDDVPLPLGVIIMLAVTESEGDVLCEAVMDCVNDCDKLGVNEADWLWESDWLGVGDKLGVDVGLGDRDCELVDVSDVVCESVGDPDREEVRDTVGLWD